MSGDYVMKTILTIFIMLSISFNANSYILETGFCANISGDLTSSTNGYMDVKMSLNKQSYKDEIDTKKLNNLLDIEQFYKDKIEQLSIIYKNLCSD